MENDTNPENFLDELNSIVSFNVIGSDYWNSGKTMRNSESCFMDGTISLEV